jgi:hypothetical protein
MNLNADSLQRVLTGIEDGSNERVRCGIERKNQPCTSVNPGIRLVAAELLP